MKSNRCVGPMLVVALLAMAWSVPAASAKPLPPFTFLPPTSLSALDGYADTPQVAISRRGDAIAIWHRSVGGQSVVEAASRPAGHAWSPPTVFSAQGDLLSPSVAMTPDGDALAVWYRSTGCLDGFCPRLVPEVASRRAGGRWSKPAVLGAPGEYLSGDQGGPHVAITPKGAALVVWARVVRATGWPVVEAVSRSVGGKWSKPTVLSRRGRYADSPQVAVNRKGDALVAWGRSARRSPDEPRGVVEVASRSAGGRWSSPRRLSVPGQVGGQHVAVTRQGEALVVWSRYTHHASVVELASRPAGKRWSKPTVLSAANGGATSPSLAVNDRGDAVVVWSDLNDARHGVKVASRSAGKAWSRPTSLKGVRGMTQEPRVAMSPKGDALVVWQTIIAGDDRVVQAASRPAGGRWSIATVIGGHSSGAPRVAVADKRHAVVAWTRDEPPGSVVQAAITAVNSPTVALRSGRH